MRAVWVAGLIGLLGASAHADPRVALSVESTTVQVGVPFLILVQAQGSAVDEPQIPEVEGLMIESEARQRSDQTRFVMGGSRSTIRVRGYLARATRPGVIRIPPVVVGIDGADVSSNPLELTATKGAPPVAPSDAAQTPAAGQAQPAAAGSGHSPTFDDVVLLDASVDKSEVYVGQQVTLTLSLWVLQMNGVYVDDTPFGNSGTRWPATEGFYAVPQEPRRAGESVKERNGWPYQVIEYKQVLYPTGVGDLSVGPWHWEGRARARTDMGYQRRSYALDTGPVAVHAKALPPQPDGFTGAVGQFDVKAYLTDTQVVQGVPTRLVVRVIGQGNPDAIGELRLPAIPDVFVAEAEKEVKPISDPSGLTVEKSFTYPITPIKAGALTIPQLSYVYFDPVSERYESRPVGPFAVTVTPSDESQQRVLVGNRIATPEEKQVAVLGEGIQPVILSPGRLGRTGVGPVGLSVLVVAPPLGWGLFAAFMRRRRRFASDRGYARAYHALRKGHRGLHEAARASDPPEALYRAVSGFIADSLDVTDAGMTSADAERLFRERSIDSDLGVQFSRILRACERCRYGAVALSGSEFEALLSGARTAMDRLDGMVRRERVSP